MNEKHKWETVGILKKKLVMLNTWDTENVNDLNQ